MLYIRHITGPHKIPLDPDNEASTGLANCALNLALVQARKGHRVEVLGFSPHGASVSNWRGVTIRTFSSRLATRLDRWNLGWFLEFWLHTSLRAKADIHHIHHWPEAGRLPGSKARVLHWHWLFSGVSAPFVGSAARKVKAMIFPSDFLRNEFRGNQSHTPGYVVPNGARHSDYQNACGKELRQSWGIAPDTAVIVFVGAVRPEKGLLPLIEAYRIVTIDRGTKAKLVVAGGGDLWTTPDLANSDYEARVRHAASGADVHFMGLVPRADIPDVYKVADVVVVPSIVPESQGTVVCEAMMAGRPVIGSRIGGIPEMIVEGETGFLVPPGDVQAIANALCTLVNNPGLRERMGRRGYERAIKEYTWEPSARKVEQIYYQALNGHRGASINR